MSPKKHIDNIFEYLYKLKGHAQFTSDGLLIYADIELEMHEIRKLLEEREDYERDN